MSAFIWAPLYWVIDYWHPVVVKYAVHSQDNVFTDGIGVGILSG